MRELTNEEALDLFADILEPLGEILGDTAVADAFREKRIKGVKVAIKAHKKAVIELLALMDGENPESYKVGVWTLPIKLLQLFNQPEFNELFTLQSRTSGGGSSGSATVNTEGDGD